MSIMGRMSSGYLWIKAFHIVFVASWFAGLNHGWFRVFNEASVLLFAATVVLVVVKPAFR
jgi:uncharacterized membrane protein